MQTSTWVTMLLVMGTVWGGFLFLVAKALRAEARKRGE